MYLLYSIIVKQNHINLGKGRSRRYIGVFLDRNHEKNSKILLELKI